MDQNYNEYNNLTINGSNIYNNTHGIEIDKGDNYNNDTTFNITNSNIPILLNVPASHLMHNKPTGALDGYNYVQVFLALYLAENDIDVNYYVPYTRKLSFLESVLGWMITRFGTTQQGSFLVYLSFSK